MLMMHLRVTCLWWLQHLHEVLTATESGRDSDINNSMENIMPRVKLIDASLKVPAACCTELQHCLQILQSDQLAQHIWHSQSCMQLKRFQLNA